MSEAIGPGGAICIFGYIFDNSHLSPPEPVAINLNFVSIYDEAQNYTEHEYEEWLAEAGAEGFHRTLRPDGRSTLIGRKQA